MQLVKLKSHTPHITTQRVRLHKPLCKSRAAKSSTAYEHAVTLTLIYTTCHCISSTVYLPLRSPDTSECLFTQDLESQLEKVRQRGKLCK